MLGLERAQPGEPTDGYAQRIQLWCAQAAYQSHSYAIPAVPAVTEKQAKSARDLDARASVLAPTQRGTSAISGVLESTEPLAL